MGDVMASSDLRRDEVEGIPAPHHRPARETDEHVDKRQLKDQLLHVLSGGDHSAAGFAGDDVPPVEEEGKGNRGQLRHRVEYI